MAVEEKLPPRSVLPHPPHRPYPFSLSGHSLLWCEGRLATFPPIFLQAGENFPRHLRALISLHLSFLYPPHHCCHSLPYQVARESLCRHRVSHSRPPAHH